MNPEKLPAKELGLRDCQQLAITNLESSFDAARPRALVQMATGSGKTFTAITSVYRLLKYANGKRILFLVDTKNLGEKAEQEFMAYTPYRSGIPKLHRAIYFQRRGKPLPANGGQTAGWSVTTFLPGWAGGGLWFLTKKRVSAEARQFTDSIKSG